MVPRNSDPSDVSKLTLWSDNNHNLLTCVALLAGGRTHTAAAAVFIIRHNLYTPLTLNMGYWYGWWKYVSRSKVHMKTCHSVSDETSKEGEKIQ